MEDTSPWGKKPSAWLPLAMSLTSLAVVILHVTLRGVAHETDEGTAAHIWQLLMVAQLPLIAYFAVKWLPRAPRDALVVLALQTAAGLLAAAPVVPLGL